MAVKEIIFFVTNNCNLNCSFCCNADVHNVGKEINLKEYESIAKSVKQKLEKVIISGGEPTLRRDLPEIIELFYRYNHVGKIDIPFNGFLPEETLCMVKKIVSACPDARLTVDVSIDGFEDTHNRMRGNPLAFKRSIRTLEMLTDYRKENNKKEDEFRIFVNTLVIPANFMEVKQFKEWMRENFPDIFHSLIIAREENTRGIRQYTGLSREQIKVIRNIILENAEYYHRRYSFLYRIYVRILTSMLIDMTMRDKDKKGYFKCMAPKFHRVIYPDGSVSVCEMLPAFANLKDYKFNFREMEETLKIDKKKPDCFCAHSCFFCPSIRDYPLNIVNYFLDKFIPKFKIGNKLADSNN